VWIQKPAKMRIKNAYVAYSAQRRTIMPCGSSVMRCCPVRSSPPLAVMGAALCGVRSARAWPRARFVCSDVC
jgi:hypothetical protein